MQLRRRRKPDMPDNCINRSAASGFHKVQCEPLAMGFQMFVPKPVEADELASIIESLVGRIDKGMGA